MVMIIKHIAYMTCFVTNDSWHANDVIVVYKKHHGDGRISYFAEPSIRLLAGTAMGEVGPLAVNGASKTVVGYHDYGRGRAHNPGGMPPGQEAKTIEKNIVLTNQ